MPKGRSGHTLTFIGNLNYMLYGGIEDAGNGKIQPNGDVWIMNMARGKFISFQGRGLAHEDELGRAALCLAAKNL